MPTTYGRPRPALDASAATFAFPNPSSLSNLGSNSKDDNPTSRSPSPDFLGWKKKLDAIDKDMYDGEMVREEALTSSSLTPLTASSSLSTAPPTQSAPAPVLPRSSPPSSPAPAYRDPDHLTDDPDTSVELNTTVTAPSSDPEDEPTLGHADDKDDSDDEPAVKRRMVKPSRIFDSDEDEENVAHRKSTSRRKFTIASTSPTSSGNDFSQLSLNRPGVRSSSATTPASSAQKPLLPELSDDSDEDRGVTARDEDSGDQIEDAKESPNHSRALRKKGLNKAEKVQMAKTQQAILQDREYEIPDASKRIDPKAFFSSFSTRQTEIDSYPFPPGNRTRKSVSQPSRSDDKSAIRRKIGMLPLSAHSAPKFEPPSRSTIPQSDPIMSSSQSQGFPALKGRAKSEEDEEEGGLGSLNSLGASMFGSSKPKGLLSGGDVFGPNGESDEELPAASSLFSRAKKPTDDADKKRALTEKKRAALAAQQASRRVVPDSDSDMELEVASQANKGKGKAAVKARILARPGQEALAARKPTQDDMTESQVARAGHATHFGRDAALVSSSPVRGGGVYEESQFARAPLPGFTPSRVIRPKPTARKSTGAKGGLAVMELVKFAAKKAQVVGQALQKEDEEKWKASGGRMKISRNEMEPGEERAEGGDEDEDEDDEDYRGSASESEEEEDKENLPATGRTRQPHEPVSDLDGSGGDEPADADKENSLEMAGAGARSPAFLGVRSPGPLNDGSPAPSPGRLASTLSPAHQFGRSPSHLQPHSRVSSSSSMRMPLSQLGDEDAAAGETENAAVTRAVLGELDVELKADAEDEDEELPRRPAKRIKSSISRRLFDDEEEGNENPPAARLLSPSQRRLGSPSQRRLGSPSHRLGSPSQRTARFRSPPSRLRSPLPGSGTQSFSQVETQAMLGGLGDVFGFETQAPGMETNNSAGDSGGGLTQLFANAEVGTSSAFAALRPNADSVELTQDEKTKLLYRPVLGDEELRRDQEIFERDGELMAQPFSPTQREKETQQWLNERGLWTQTKPPQADSDPFEPRSTPISLTQLGTPSPLASPTGSATARRRIIRKGPAIDPEPEELENTPSAKIPSLFTKMMNRGQDPTGKDKDKQKKKPKKSEFIEGEAAESDDEYEGFRPRARGDDEEEEDGEEQHVEGLVDDVAMDERTENAADVQAKYLEQNAEDDARNEKIAREVVTGKLRNRRRGRGDNMDLDEDYESEDDGYSGPKKLLKKRKIKNDGLDGLEKHASTRPFVEAYSKGMQSAEDDEFQYLNQVVELDGAPELGGGPDLDEEEEEDDEAENEEEEEEEEEIQPETKTPFKAIRAQQHVPSSTGAKVSFGLDDSDEELTVDLPDAAPRPMGPLTRNPSANNSRLTTWASHEGNNPRVGLRGGQGASVTGHSKTKSAKTKGGSFARPTAANASSSSSNKLSRLGSKASGFA